MFRGREYVTGFERHQLHAVKIINLFEFCQ
jgi:hypothetical protein